MANNPWRLGAKAQQIATERPDIWEYRLFAQIIIDEIEACKKSLQPPAYSSETSMITPSDLPVWAPQKLHELSDLLHQIETLVKSDHTDAFGPPGQPGNVAAIVALSRKIGLLYRRIAEWPLAIQNTPIDPRCAGVVNELASFAPSYTASIERFALELLQKIEHVLRAPPGSELQDITVTLTLEAPNGDRLEKVKRLVATNPPSKVNTQMERRARQFQRQAAREAKYRYSEDRIKEASERNEVLNTRLEELSSILEDALASYTTVSFDQLRIHEGFSSFNPPRDLTAPLMAPKKADYLATVAKPNLIERCLPGSQEKYQSALRAAEARYNSAVKDYEARETKRLAELEKLAADHEAARQAFLLKVAQRDHEVDELIASYQRGDPAAVISYNSMVLEHSVYPDGFPKEFRLAYVSESKELVVEYEMPSPDVIPPVAEYRYIKSRDAIEEKPQSPAEIRELYQDIVASVAIGTIHRLFQADQDNHLQVIAFNGLVHTIHPATGKYFRPCLLSIRVTRDRFGELDLSRVNKAVCLRNLGAQVSPRPDEMLAVKPIIEFDMVDKRFVEHGDILADLDARPNLMDLNPFEFENLICNLFAKMGLDSKLTRSARDGGIDVVAFDARPIVGGKVVIQAKRYRNTVGVAAVRDLYGTMINEGANKGILVTTSGYGPDAYDFAKDKPLELVDGGGLLYLLESHGGVRARIIFPTEE